ncbi:hypothetical protein VPH35_074424 [Triticum aestivum]|uniref:putative F-box protein At3g10240 n=1 Tax=Triticum aestivum TaxID=4565 RepID=UPI00162F0C9A|nr:putative F-box protein At3g10240 [Triticum aestivum]
MIGTMSQPGERATENTTLDDDVVTEILLRLPSASVFRSRAVCKAWHRITTDPSFLAAHADRRPAELLVVSRGEPSFLETIPLSLQVDDLTRRRSQLHHPEDCEIGVLLGCCDGLVLFQKSPENLLSNDVFLCNPMTRQWARLDVTPPSCRGLARLCCFYRHCPSGEHRLLVLANEPEPGLAAHYVYTLAAAATSQPEPPRRLGLVADGVVVDLFTNFIHHYADHRGKIHWTVHPLASSTEKILAFDTVSEDFRLISRPPWPRDHYHDEDLCLMELDGRLAVTAPELHGDSMELWVLVDYDDDQSWSRRFRIVLPPLFYPHWWTGTGVPNVVFVASYTHNFKALYHLTEKRIVNQIEYINGTWGYCYLFKDSLVPHSFLNPY